MVANIQCFSHQDARGEADAPEPLHVKSSSFLVRGARKRAGSSVTASLESSHVITLTGELHRKTLGEDARVKRPENTLEYKQEWKEMTTYCMDVCIAGTALPCRNQVPNAPLPPSSHSRTLSSSSQRAREHEPQVVLPVG
ncbi:uncharacterized protein PRD47_010648 [Ara ararauna]